VSGITAIARITGEQWVIAQIFRSIATVSAPSASSTEPRHANALPDFKLVDCAADQVDAADDFVSRDDGKLGIRQLTIDDMQIGTAHPAGRHPQSHFARRGPGI
jgi:hypothetical protein